ncbi:peptidase S28 [Truncatella angustata]|uniref:Peptidase S28 n=1 Tax=Truncatella angustata TaxID=152316 RepID=A0A9P8ZW35_9PEZI|nr:peptidase S28 [Truncatella angustata]KAH6652577.1 peptidase S28 [Truncatella angustata]KAH8203813.1 hypothetical protein TruAng_001990 [Truncatella angustata]
MVRHGITASLLSLPLLAQAVQLGLGSLPVPASQLRKQAEAHNTFSVEEAQIAATYPAYTLSTPIDHFHNDSRYEPHSDGFYNMRYWFDARYYKPGGPVIVLAGGETSGTGRLPFIQKGVVAQIANATNGIGVVLEHRYYGTSWPVNDTRTESMRFLSTDQALADAVYFAQNGKFPGLESYDINPNNTAYIAYGGSYAGAFVAILRKLYPDVYFGSIASSAVTEAIYDYWQYFEAARIYGPTAGIEATQKVTNVVDNILIGKNGTEYPQKLKEVFGLGGVTKDADFASTLTNGLGYLQSYNWDPTQSSSEFFRYAAIVGNDSVVYASTESLRSTVTELIEAGGWGNETEKLSNHFLNFIGYVRESSVASCTEADQNVCFGTSDPELYTSTDASQTWKSWPYQYCTEWGYLTTGSGVPAGQLPLISRTIDIAYNAQICVEAFNITTPSDVEIINKHGGFSLSYPRLAFIDGEWDPWRAATPHAIGLERPDTISEPFRLISGGVHHWDENGLFPNETTAQLPPPSVKENQQYEVEFVTAWLKDWETEKSTSLGQP